MILSVDFITSNEMVSIYKSQFTLMTDRERERDREKERQKEGERERKRIRKK